MICSDFPDYFGGMDFCAGVAFAAAGNFYLSQAGLSGQGQEEKT